MAVKYYLDVSVGDAFIMNNVDDPEAPAICGCMSDIGIEENDPDWSEKLDRYFESNFNILPDEWEMG